MKINQEREGMHCLTVGTEQQAGQGCSWVLGANGSRILLLLISASLCWLGRFPPCVLGVAPNSSQTRIIK